MNRNWINYILLFLLVLNLSVTGTILVKQRSIKKYHLKSMGNSKNWHPGRGSLMEGYKNKMDLSDEHIHNIESVHRDFIHFNRELKQEIKERERLFRKELISGNIDTVHLMNLTEKVGELHAQRMRETYLHYFKIREILPDDKLRVMDSLTCDGWKRRHPEGRRKRLHHKHGNNN